MRQLTIKSRSRHELESVLKRKNVPDEAAEAVLNRMTEVGLVNDEEFAHAWVRSRQQRRNLSRSVLRRELQGKGIDAEVADEALASVSGDDEYAAARQLAEKKLRAMARLEPLVQRRRLAGALARRGFSGGLVSQVLEDVLSETPDAFGSAPSQ